MVNNLYISDMTIAESYELIKKCIKFILNRYTLRFSEFCVYIVDKTGWKSLPDISIFTLFGPDS